MTQSWRQPSEKHLPPSNQASSVGVPASSSTNAPAAIWPVLAKRSSPRHIALRYIANPSVRVRGPVTGQAYEFSSAQRIQSVDTRDAEALMKTRFFRRI
jgi:hypothetical protein